jgi:hypothetical protein
MNVKFMTAVVIVACATPLLADAIQVDATADTDGVELMSFRLKAEGSDITINTFTFTTVTSGAGVANIISDARLWMDGGEIGEATISANVGEITFDDLNLDDVIIEAGDTATFTLEVDINDFIVDDVTIEDGVIAYFTLEVEGALGNTVQVIAPEPSSLLLLATALPLAAHRRYSRR